MHDYTVYVLRCADNTLYTGITTDLERRVTEHNGEISGGAKYTSTRNPVRVVYQEGCDSRSAASKREYEIKRLSRKEKLDLIKEYKS